MIGQAKAQPALLVLVFAGIMVKLGYQLTAAGHKLSNERVKIAGLAPGSYEIRIDGELIGGCDITLELYQKGDLQKMVKEATGKEA